MLPSVWMMTFSFSFDFIIWLDDNIDVIIFWMIKSMLSPGLDDNIDVIIWLDDKQ
jgi:hypothetical protein